MFRFACAPSSPNELMYERNRWGNSDDGCTAFLSTCGCNREDRAMPSTERLFNLFIQSVRESRTDSVNIFSARTGSTNPVSAHRMFSLAMDSHSLKSSLLSHEVPHRRSNASPEAACR